MVLLSRILPYTANRWANIVAGVLNTASVTGSLILAPHYLLFATIEIACTLFIIWYAWTWRGAEGGPTPRSSLEPRLLRADAPRPAEGMRFAGS
jgi:threonine/homoserine/homoserine lactone efflux protein